jgi:transcription initiation factor TFIID subunit 5
MESANQEIDGRPLPPLGEDARPKYKKGFGKHIFSLSGRNTVANELL